MPFFRLPKLHVDPVAAAVFSGLIFTERFEAVAALTAAVVLHEAGHFFAAALLHIPVGEIRLGLFGARMEVRGILSYRREFLLAAAGPAASFTGAAFSAAATGAGNFLQYFCALCLVLGGLNLLPVRTFDGGRMAYCLLAARWGEAFAAGILRGVSFCFLLLLWCFSVYLLLRAGSGISWLGFSAGLLSQFFAEKD